MMSAIRSEIGYKYSSADSQTNLPRQYSTPESKQQLEAEEQIVGRRHVTAS